MSSIWFLSSAPHDSVFSTAKNGSFLEFNRDLFLCNQITDLNDDYPQSADSTLCQDTDIDTICNIKDNNFLSVKQCEICKNFNYRDWYDSNIPSVKAFSDAREEYLRTWLQSWNLGIGIIIVLYGIYYQQS
jgi:hypothetical protein